MDCGRGPKLQLTCRVEILQSFSHTSTHRLLALPDPDSRIEELLVRFVFSLRVANCRHQVILLLQDIVTDAGQVGKL
jgi:hypothetical protein